MAGNTRHGMSGTPTYKSWSMMLDRCRNPKHHKYARYGGRGIGVCARWSCFENFLADMRERPPGTTLDRIDTNGDYEPGNCRWATPLEQQANRTNNVMVVVQGRVVNAEEAGRLTGVPGSTVRSRVRRNAREVA